MTDREAAQLEAELLYEIEADDALRREIARAVAHMAREAALLRQALLQDNALLRVTDEPQRLLKEVRAMYGAAFRALCLLDPKRRNRGHY